jgi:hypothetical protein
MEFLEATSEPEREIKGIQQSRSSRRIREGRHSRVISSKLGGLIYFRIVVNFLTAKEFAV